MQLQEIKKLVHDDILEVDKLIVSSLKSGVPIINTNPSPANPFPQPVSNLRGNRDGTNPREMCIDGECFYMIPKDQYVAWTGKQKKSET